MRKVGVSSRCGYRLDTYILELPEPLLRVSMDAKQGWSKVKTWLSNLARVLLDNSIHKKRSL